MFAVLQASPEVSLDTLVEVAQAFSPRFQIMGPFVLVDVDGLSSLFGSADDLGASLRAACPACRSMAVAPTAAAALLLAAGHEGLTVVSSTEARTRLSGLPLDLLAEVAEARLPPLDDLAGVTGGGRAATPGTSEAGAVGWRHPRDTHQAQRTRRPRLRPVAPGPRRQALAAIQQTRATLQRWGIHTLGALAALPGADLHERLGDLGVEWQRLARGEDDLPLVPWLAEPVFEASLDLEWPIEGFEPLSFVLARLFEPLAEQLERADRGALSIRTALHLTTRTVHLRVLPLPAPMRDPKTLRTLVLLDLESHAPGAAIDRVQVRLEPTPGRVLQWTLFEPAQPAPEQVATLMARLSALVGEGHVGSPALVDSWRPGAFAMAPFQPGAVPEDEAVSIGAAVPPPASPTVLTPTGTAVPGLSAADCALALRRFRLPIPVRVRVDEGRPAHVVTDRHGITGGGIVQAAGPWRTSGEWWEQPRPAGATAWDRDEWDVAMADGTVYRLSVERSVGHWTLEGVFD